MINKRNFIKCLLIFFLLMKINPAFVNIGLSPIVEISERARLLAPEFEKSGKHFIYFQRGEVGFDTPDYVKKAISEAIHDKKLTKYPKSGGEPWFKDAILKYLSELGISNLNRENILCTYGGQEGLQLAFSSFVSCDNEGRIVGGPRVLGFDPIWSCMLENILPYSGSSIDLVPFIEQRGNLDVDFETLERRLSEADILYLNNPHNPTGKVFSAEELREINRLCVENGVTIISDEAYRDIVFDGNRHVSMLEFPGDHIISVFTFSKAFAATGLRVGYTVTRNKDHIPLLTRAEYTQTAGVVTSNQHGFKVAVENVEERDKWINYMVAQLQGRRDVLYEEIKRIFNKPVYRPQGAFYFFLDLNPFIGDNIPMEDRDEFILEKFLEKGIAVIHGSAFSKERYKGYVRISYSTIDEGMILEGIGRMEEVLNSLYH